MMFGAWGNPDHDDSIAIIHAALDAGINFIDTADVYSAGESEEIVGKALEGRRDDVVLATKFLGPMGADPNQSGDSRRWIMRECEDSLRRLGTDHIDLYQIHRPEPDDRHRRDARRARPTSCTRARSATSAARRSRPSAIVEAQWVAERRGRERFVCEQPPYSILVRGIEADVLPTCERYGMGVIPWSPLAGGWLSGKWRLGADDLTSRRAQRIPDRYDLSTSRRTRPSSRPPTRSAVLADEAGISLIHLALAFVHQPPGGHRRRSSGPARWSS